MSSQAVIRPAATGHLSGRRFSLAAIPLLSTAFGVVQGTTINAVLPMATFGLAWGLAAAAIAPRVARWGARSVVRADAPLALALPLAWMVLGGGLLGSLLAVSPRAQLALFEQSRFGLFFFAIHTTFEWVLIPAVVMLNWQQPNRRWLVVAAAVLFYAGRISSALYFAPNAMAWGADPGLATLDEVQQWMNLNWARLVIQDTATAVLLLLAAFVPVKPPAS